jgi:hypothetical protein
MRGGGAGGNKAGARLSCRTEIGRTGDYSSQRSRGDLSISQKNDEKYCKSVEKIERTGPEGLCLQTCTHVTYTHTGTFTLMLAFNR